MMKKVLLAGMVALAIAAAPQAASAAAILRFDNTGGQAGNLNYSGVLGTALSGTGITFNEIDAEGTSNDGNYVCQGCVLNFSTGGSTAELPGIVQFGSGGSFVVTGTVLDGMMNVIANGTLLSGSFDGTPTLLDVGNNVQFVATGIDTKNERLLAFLGLTNVNFSFANSEITAAGNFGAGNSLNATVTEADLVNTESVPEPVSIALLGMGLLGVGAARRRNRR